MKKLKQTLFLSLSIFAAVGFTSCKSEKKQITETDRIVIWTNCSEFAQYIELFNKTHKDNKAILVYKENPALSLPPEKDELPPDLIVGPWLGTGTPQKNYKSLDYLFDMQKLTSDLFYPQLLEAGKKHHVQYLLPVSFNLPAIIFSNNNKNYITDSYTISLDQIKEVAGSYNQKDKKDAYTRIGFTPYSNEDFLYLATKLYGANFHEEKNQIVWNDDNLKKTTDYLKNWIETQNTSTQKEVDFAFKYLFMPPHRQVDTNRTLFAYTTSNQLFRVVKEQNLNIDYRWIVEDKNLPIEDSFTTMGIYKKSKNQVGATEFISWFFQAENQRAILERKELFNLETENFGIANGFSSVRYVNEHVLPLFYTKLLTNVPSAQMLTVPPQLPARWTSYKTMVVEPYLKNVIAAENGITDISIADLEKEWRKKVFD